ncbi:MAG TPA: NAD(P)(+) transhydrogenase (Re/Si-specific) subunit alpha, partial [Leucothrix sp.]|nr:NAD(P)(+) transhydrogenase (Re/Si-specific) subunit alpha [Leucothrix sp.]
MPIKLGIPRETAQGERRVAIDAMVISRLSKLGIEIFVEQGAGKSALISDAQFEGATMVASAQELSEKSDIIWRVQAPTADEVNLMREGSVLIGTLMAHNNIAMLKALEDKKITSFAMELVPRISRAQSMDVLSSQAAIAGYKAAIMGADIAPRFFPMLTTAAGTIRPSKVIVIGVGVAGLQAIATAKRL